MMTWWSAYGDYQQKARKRERERERERELNEDYHVVIVNHPRRRRCGR
jgi:hypothetical protein